MRSRSRDAFSPEVWWLGLQNQPYPLVYLFVVLYLLALHVREGAPPAALR